MSYEISFDYVYYFGLDQNFHEIYLVCGRCYENESVNIYVSFFL